MPTVASPYMRLAALGIRLTKAPDPIGQFAPYRIERGLIHISGQGPIESDGTFKVGKVGLDVTETEAKEHARLVGINLIAVLHEATGDLDRISGITKLFGMVNAHSEFVRHPAVIDGCSSLLLEVFGDRGVHARTSIGVSSLPNGITVEIECIAALKHLDIEERPQGSDRA